LPQRRQESAIAGGPTLNFVPAFNHPSPRRPLAGIDRLGHPASE